MKQTDHDKYCIYKYGGIDIKIKFALRNFGATRFLKNKMRPSSRDIFTIKKFNSVSLMFPAVGKSINMDTTQGPTGWKILRNAHIVGFTQGKSM